MPSVHVKGAYMGNFTAAELATIPSFINYCNRTDEADVIYWERFLGENPGKAALISEARELVRIGGWMLLAEKEKTAALDKLDAYLYPAPSLRSRRRLWPYYVAAASLAAAVTVGVFLFRPGIQPDTLSDELVIAGGSARKSLTLPDSSFILLEHGANVSMEPGFGKSSRAVRLHGVAYFRVAKDEIRPFRVLAGPYIITALGTSFRVSTKADSLQVMLEEGKVKVERQTADGLELIAVLSPSERLDLHGTASHTPARSNFRSADLQAWKAQEIIFDNTPLDEAVRQLEACYNIRISLEGIDAKKETFSGRFRNDRLTEVLDVICFTLNKRYEIKGEDSTDIIIH